jgi:hypothetical protein
MQFLTVIVPMREDDAPATITRVSDAAVSVKFRGRQTAVSFTKGVDGDIVADSVFVGQ